MRQLDLPDLANVARPEHELARKLVEGIRRNQVVYPLAAQGIADFDAEELVVVLAGSVDQLLSYLMCWHDLYGFDETDDDILSELYRPHQTNPGDHQ